MPEAKLTLDYTPPEYELRIPFPLPQLAEIGKWTVEVNFLFTRNILSLILPKYEFKEAAVTDSNLILKFRGKS
jgi:hypothetical protein